MAVVSDQPYHNIFHTAHNRHTTQHFITNQPIYRRHKSADQFAMTNTLSIDHDHPREKLQQDTLTRSISPNTLQTFDAHCELSRRTASEVLNRHLCSPSSGIRSVSHHCHFAGHRTAAGRITPAAFAGGS